MMDVVGPGLGKSLYRARHITLQMVCSFTDRSAMTSVIYNKVCNSPIYDFCMKETEGFSTTVTSSRNLSR